MPEFLVGVFVGAAIGLVAVALCVAAKDGECEDCNDKKCL